MEHLYRCFQVVVGEGDDVGVGAVAQHDGLFFQCALERTEVVTQPCGPFEVELVGRRGHLPFQITGEPVGLAGQKVAEVIDDLTMPLCVHSAHARGRTFVDVAEQAGPLDLAVPLEHSCRAGTGGEYPGQQIQGLADRPGMGVRAEIAHPLAAWAAVHHQPRKLLVEGHREHRIGLVVAVADVEPRIELLDPVVLELQRLHLGGHHGPFDFGRCGDHLTGPGVQTGHVGEV